MVRILIMVYFVFASYHSMAQADCMASAGMSNFFNTCETGTSYSDPDDYEFRVTANRTMVINGVVNITGTLTIDLDGLNSSVRILNTGSLQAGNIVFKGSASQGHLFDADGSLISSNVLNFGFLPIEINGDGTVDALNIAEADNISCIEDLDCPTVTSTTCDDGPTGTFCDSVLPIELNFFRSTTTANTIELHWQTATEENNDIFTIERSTDAKNYKALGVVPGAGDSFGLLNYSFTDSDPIAGRAYYRLKQTDYDGHYEYFGPITVNLEGIIPSSKINIWPNPVRQGEEVVITTEVSEQEYDVRLMTLQGHELRSDRISAWRSGKILTTDLRPGIYVIELAAPSGIEFRRLHVR